MPSMGNHGHTKPSTSHIDSYSSFGAKPLPQTMRSEHRGESKHKSTIEAFKPKTPNVDIRTPMTPNFEPFGRCGMSCVFSYTTLNCWCGSRERVDGPIPATRIGTPNYEANQYGRPPRTPNFEMFPAKYRRYDCVNVLQLTSVHGQISRCPPNV